MIFECIRRLLPVYKHPLSIHASWSSRGRCYAYLSSLFLLWTSLTLHNHLHSPCPEYVLLCLLHNTDSIQGIQPHKLLQSHSLFRLYWLLVVLSIGEDTLSKSTSIEDEIVAVVWCINVLVWIMLQRWLFPSELVLLGLPNRSEDSNTHIRRHDFDFSLRTSWIPYKLQTLSLPF